MPIYGILILQSIRCSPTLWAVTQPSQFRSIMDKDEFVREPQISLYSVLRSSVYVRWDRTGHGARQYIWLVEKFQF